MGDITVGNLLIIMFYCNMIYIYTIYNSKTYLGVTITNDITMTAHIYINILIQLWKIRESLPSKTVYLLANALTFTRLDYCSILLINSTKQKLQQLNRIIINQLLESFLINANTMHVLYLMSFTDVLFTYFANRNTN